MKAAENGCRYDAAHVLDSATDRSVFVERPMSPQLIIIDGVLRRTPTEKQPRGFAIDPTGRFVVVAGEKSDTLSSYAIDAENGTLKLIGRYPTGKGPNWVEILAFD